MLVMVLLFILFTLLPSTALAQQPTQAPAPLKPCQKDSDCLTSGIKGATCIAGLCMDPNAFANQGTATQSGTSPTSTETAAAECALNKFNGCIEKIKTPVGYAVVAAIALVIILSFSCIICCACKVCCFAVKTTKSVAGAGLSITSAAAKGVARAAKSGSPDGRNNGRSGGSNYTTEEERKRPPSDNTVQYHRDKIYGDRAGASTGAAAAASVAVGSAAASTRSGGRDRYDDDRSYRERDRGEGPAPLPSNYKKPPQYPIEQLRNKEFVDIAGKEATKIVKTPAAVDRTLPYGAAPMAARMQAPEPSSQWANGAPQRPGYPYGQQPPPPGMGRPYDPYGPPPASAAPYGYNQPPVDPYAMAGYQSNPYNQGYAAAGYNQYNQPPPQQQPYNNGYGQQPYQQGYNNNPQGYDYNDYYGGAPNPNGSHLGVPDPEDPYGSKQGQGSITNYNHGQSLPSNGVTPVPGTQDEAPTEQGAGNVARWAEQQRLQLERGGFEDDDVGDERDFGEEVTRADSRLGNPATMARRSREFRDDESESSESQRGDGYKSTPRSKNGRDAEPVGGRYGPSSPMQPRSNNGSAVNSDDTYRRPTATSSPRQPPQPVRNGSRDEYASSPRSARGGSRDDNAGRDYESRSRGKGSRDDYVASPRDEKRGDEEWERAGRGAGVETAERQRSRSRNRGQQGGEYRGQPQQQGGEYRGEYREDYRY
ncbi:hypothetical protein HDU97_007844 [Phlyctochytrium planicorne]|nr:hypothetical protein HDU97_007844 [Phlyctochytrium planicorne]